MGVGAYDTYDISMPLAMLAFKKPLFTITITITNLHLRSWLLQFPGILARLHVPANPANGHNSSYTSRMGVVGAWFIWSEALSNPTYWYAFVPKYEYFLNNWRYKLSLSTRGGGSDVYATSKTQWCHICCGESRKLGNWVFLFRVVSYVGWT